MPKTDPLRDLELLIRSRHGLIHLETVEEDRAEALLRHVADGLGLPLFCWSITRGLRRVDLDNAIYDTAEPAKALLHAEQSGLAALFHSRGLGPFLQDARLASRLAELAAQFRGRSGAVILTGTELVLPQSLLRAGATLRLPAPRPEEYRRLLQHILRDLESRGPVKVELSLEERNSLLQALAGLTLLEAEKVLTKAIVEIEKAFSVGGGSDDSGVSTRILGTFLSWLQDRRGDVFVVATANDVSRLPAELLRKGRFDEIFFVDLPDPESRRTVWAIHLQKRNQQANRFSLDVLVDASEGFSGAEIEQVIVSGLYTAFAERTALSDDILQAELLATRPLSVTMAERIAELRAWKEGRTASAH